MMSWHLMAQSTAAAAGMGVVVLIAEAAPNIPDFVPGTAAWITSLASGGILTWLLFYHLPAKDKQLKEFTDNKDTQFQKMAADYNGQLNSIHDDCAKERREAAIAFMVAIKENSQELHRALNLIMDRAQADGERLSKATQTEMQTLNMSLGTVREAVIGLREAVKALHEKVGLRE